MAVWCRLWSFGIFFPFWYVLTKKNLATLTVRMAPVLGEVSNTVRRNSIFDKSADCIGMTERMTKRLDFSARQNKIAKTQLSGKKIRRKKN
jgi:hypothetical protein